MERNERRHWDVDDRSSEPSTTTRVAQSPRSSQRRNPSNDNDREDVQENTIVEEEAKLKGVIVRPPNTEE